MYHISFTEGIPKAIFLIIEQDSEGNILHGFTHDRDAAERTCKMLKAITDRRCFNEYDVHFNYIEVDLVAVMDYFLNNFPERIEYD